MKILVTGGAGYIGSITVKALEKEGYDVVVLDNLSNGHRENVQRTFLQGDLLDMSFLDSIQDTFDGVIHFAAYTLAGESMEKPYDYFRNNIQGGLNLLEFMRKRNMRFIIFSSTCALYGTPERVPVDENVQKKPESVYGESKLMFESILRWYDVIYDIKHINLRYFNAAGASLDGSLGEDHNPETHIIPIAIQVALGKRKEFLLYGNDYPTPDGTCVRDYIHVEDLAAAHILALKKIMETKTSDVFNLGIGKGYSNKEVLEMVKKVSGRELQITMKPRRPGDPPMIYADNAKAIKHLGFHPEHSDLQTIVETAWKYYQRREK